MSDELDVQFLQLDFGEKRPTHLVKIVEGTLREQKALPFDLAWDYDVNAILGFLGKKEEGVSYLGLTKEETERLLPLLRHYASGVSVFECVGNKNDFPLFKPLPSHFSSLYPCRQREI